MLSAALVYETQPSGSTPPYGFVLAALVCVAGVLLLRGDRADAGRGQVPGQRRPVETAPEAPARTASEPDASGAR